MLVCLLGAWEIQYIQSGSKLPSSSHPKEPRKPRVFGAHCPEWARTGGDSAMQGRNKCMPSRSMWSTCEFLTCQEEGNVQMSFCEDRDVFLPYMVNTAAQLIRSGSLPLARMCAHMPVAVDNCSTYSGWHPTRPHPRLYSTFKAPGCPRDEI